MAAITSTPRFGETGKRTSAASRTGWLRRAVNAFVAARRVRAEEEIAAIVARRGGCMRREAYAPSIPSRPNDPFGQRGRR